MAFRFLQRLSTFFNGFLIFLNGFPIFLNGFPLSEKSKKIYTRREVYKRSLFELRIFCHSLSNLLSELRNTHYNTQQRVIPYDSHRYLKCSLNSLPLLYIKWQHHGYLHNQVLFTNLAIRSEVLSKISSAINSSLPSTVCQCSCSTTSSSAISNQLEAGSIMVRAIKSICK